jgi:DNA-binding MarR family transcriptional regulator
VIVKYTCVEEIAAGKNDDVTRVLRRNSLPKGPGALSMRIAWDSTLGLDIRCIIEPYSLCHRTNMSKHIPERSLQDQMIALIRAFGLHRPDQTPCGQLVPVVEAHALMELQRDTPLSQQELGARLHLEKSTVSRLVAQLEGRGWMTRTRSVTDGRVLELTLSDAGRDVAAQLSAARAAKFARVLAAVPEAQRAAVVAALDILVEAMREDRERRD